ncbi:hypothetical protein AAVH_13592 [Aphelenchoides avenae]|nr:hypothetical protein AAVH_13592 [Aphelenchus avenae]
MFAWNRYFDINESIIAHRQDRKTPLQHDAESAECADDSSLATQREEELECYSTVAKLKQHLEVTRAELLLYRFTDAGCRDQLNTTLAKNVGRDSSAVHDASTTTQAIRKESPKDEEILRILDCSDRILNFSARLSDSYEAAIQKLQKALEEKDSLLISAREATAKLEATIRAKNEPAGQRTVATQHSGKDELRCRQKAEIRRLQQSLADAESVHRSEVNKLEQKLSEANVECRRYVQQMQVSLVPENQ